LLEINQDELKELCEAINMKKLGEKKEL